MKSRRVKSSGNIGKRVFEGVRDGRYTEETVQHMIDTLIQSRDRKVEELTHRLKDKVFVLTKQNIAGALKDTINAHGPITKEYIESASKRIYCTCIKLVPDQSQDS